mgnify:CR=1 FL=1
MNFNKINFKNLNKPRTNGLNIVMDNGIACGALDDLLLDYNQYIDYIKIGWGLSLITPRLKEKIELCYKYEIPVFFGGTLFEYMFQKKYFDDYLRWLKDLNIKFIEISDGTINIEGTAKIDCIKKAKNEGFMVFSEIGKKNPDDIGSPIGWVSQITDEIKAGADFIILEGRESGSAGIYRSSGEIRSGLITDIYSEHKESFDKLIFEAPNKNSQTYFIKKFGSNINLSNINLHDILSLISLRNGLRSDTFNLK